MPSLIVTRTDRDLLNLIGHYPVLQRELERAAVVPAAQVPPNVVTMNSRVRYADRTAGDRRVLRVLQVITQPERNANRI